jgi:TolB-like protein/class 3 adenylate cyclase
VSSGPVERKLAAILSADVVGYSRLMAEDEAATIRTLTDYREEIAMLVRQHRGRVVDSPGDNILAEFPTALDAVQGAVEIQRSLQVRNIGLPAERKMEFRIGVHLGDVAVEGERIYGDGVNIAARLEALAEPGGICISRTVHEQVQHKLELAYDDLGEQELKNIPKPVRAYRVRVESAVAAPKVEPAYKRRAALAVAVVLIVAVGAAALWGFYSDRSRPEVATVPVPETAPPLELPDKPSIVVLPFVNMSGDPEQEYFVDGMTEDLITDLSRISGLFVIARNSAFVYKGKPVKIEQVSRELGVRYVVEGSVRKVGDRVRITAQLVDASTDHHLWAERYDRKLEDIFALQDEVTTKIVDALEVNLTESEQAGVEHLPTDNLEAYDYFLRGIAYVRRLSPEGNRQGREMSERAIALDPEFAAAYSLLGMTYFVDWWLQSSKDPTVVKRGFELAQHALVLDDSLPGPHFVLSILHLFVNRRHDEAIAEAKKAVELDPGFVQAHFALGTALTHAGEQEEVIRVTKRALSIDPHDSMGTRNLLGNAYRLGGRYDEAIAEFRRVLSRSPDNLLSHLLLTIVYTDLGKDEEARKEAAEILRISPGFSAEAMRQRLPYKDPAVTDHMIAALRKAGLKE